MTRSRLLAVALAMAAAMAVPAVALADAEIEAATPADGAVLAAPPPEIVLTYTQELDPTRSSLTLHDSSGAQLAEGGVDDADARIMRIDPPVLEPGAYEIRSAAFSAEDAHLVRQTISFTVLAPTPSPTLEPTPTPKPSATPAPTPAPTPSPSPSPAPADPTAGSTTDILVPLLAVAVIAIAFGAWLLRNRSRRAG